jgi:threonine dehydratase
LIDRDGIAATEKLIRQHIRRTPVLEIDPRDFGMAGPPFSLVLKLEQLQSSGSFKARGAFANLLMRDVPKVGVVAASGGNHGAAVAYAARQLGVPAKIFVPTISSPAKIERIQSYGADLVVAGERYVDALAASQVWAAQSGALPVHAYDAPETICGAGTLGLELEAQAPQLETVLTGVGGGGLIAGLAAWYSGAARIIGAEPEDSPTLHAALAAGKPVNVAVGGVAADSLGARQIGEHVFPIAKAHVGKAVLVTDEAIRAAQRTLWAVVRLVVEPGGAAAFAALLSGRYIPRTGERVGVVLSGANTTAVDFAP